MEKQFPLRIAKFLINKGLDGVFFATNLSFNLFNPKERKKHLVSSVIHKIINTYFIVEKIISRNIPTKPNAS